MKFIFMIFLFSFQWNAVQSWAGTFSTNIENDVRGIGGRGGDQGYTNALRFSYLLPEKDQSLWLGPFDQWFSGARINTALALGQQIYTPTDLQAVTVIADDRPYSGWLYGSYLVHVKRPNEIQTFEITVGVVGKGSLAATAQDNWHALIGRPRPKGWSNEMNGEPGLLLGYQFNKKFFEKNLGPNNSGPRFFDVVPGLGGSLGNVVTSLYAHMQVRLGYNISDDLSPIQAFPGGMDLPVLQNEEQPRAPWEAYGFIYGQERLLIRNIFVDGNSFQPSHHVDKEPLVLRYNIGVALRFKQFSAIGQQVVTAAEIRPRPEQHAYGSLTFGYNSDF